jgi:hypothetical protein
VRSARLWKWLLGVEHTVIEQVRSTRTPKPSLRVYDRPAAAASAARGALAAAPATTKDERFLVQRDPTAAHYEVDTHTGPDVA